MQPQVTETSRGGGYRELGGIFARQPRTGAVSFSRADFPVGLRRESERPSVPQTKAAQVVGPPSASEFVPVASPAKADPMIIIGPIAARHGRRLLDAKDQDDYERRLEGILALPGAVADLESVSQALRSYDPPATSSVVSFAPTFGDGGRRVLQRAGELNRLGSEVFASHLQQLTNNRFARILVLSPTDTLLFATVPYEVWDLVHAAWSGKVAALAITQAMQDDYKCMASGRPATKLPRWKRRALPNTVLRGHEASLKLLASLGCDLPEAIVPAADRLDLAALWQKTAEGHRAMVSFASAKRLARLQALG